MRNAPKTDMMRPVRSIYLDQQEIAARTARNEAFWQGSLSEYLLMWITAPDPRAGYEVPEPANEEALWTDVDYVIRAAHSKLAQTYHAGDALPVHHPWLGPDQVAAWLGAGLLLQPRENTSWVSPLIANWTSYPELKIDPENRWWKLYLEIVRASAEFGRDKWITAYPDLHSGIDGLCALRGADNFMMDLISDPESVRARMRQMTDLWKWIVDAVTDILAPFGQGHSNWTMGYSARRFLCIGQNDFSCMISPRMFQEFCLEDNVETIRHADYSLYHLDGPGAIKQLPTLLQIEELTAIQWVQGEGSPPPGKWTDLIRQIQEAGKGVQVLYTKGFSLDSEPMRQDLVNLLREVDTTKLFIRGLACSRAEADEVVHLIRRTCDQK